MPQLSKGGKWIFGWVVVGHNREIRIPPEACLEYGFQAQDDVLFTRGSRPSGGFGLGSRQTLAGKPVLPRVFAQGILSGQGRVILPQAVETQPGERLLIGHGSGLALGFLQRGPIHEEALYHPELEFFYA